MWTLTLFQMFYVNKFKYFIHFEYVFSKTLFTLNNLICVCVTGELYLPMFLESDSYISQQIIDEFQKVTKSIRQSGVEEFFDNYLKCWTRISTNITDRCSTADEFQPITFLEFQYVMIIFLSLSGLSVVIFAYEIIWFRIHGRGGCQN